MLDWVVGGFMIFVGVVAIGVGMAAARQMRLLHFSIRNEDQLKAKWDQYDLDKNGSLDIKELTAFVADSGVPMTRNEIAATFLALGRYSYMFVGTAQFRFISIIILDKNFDQHISYEEFYAWWIQAGERYVAFAV